MAKIISISTAVPSYRHKQQDILRFMEEVYNIDDARKRILRFLYHHSGIETRHSVIADYTLPMEEWKFFPHSKDLEPFPMLEQRMQWFATHACPLSLQAASKCIEGVTSKDDITHLITVSCTGMSAPGLELQLMEAMQLPPTINRSAINFMGCYAAIHGLRQASDIVKAQAGAKVLLVCTELCTLHFQKTFTENTITAPLLFADGSAAVLVTGDEDIHEGIKLSSFYAEVMKDSKSDMSWQLSSNGFVMNLSSEVPELFQQEIGPLKNRALQKSGCKETDIKYWCVHPGGKRILEAINKGLKLKDGDLDPSYHILRNYGNMSSPTILFVLKELWGKAINDKGAHIFGAAFGPGLTMESMIMKIV